MTGDVFFDVTKPQYFIKLMTGLSISIHAFGRLFASFCRRLMSHVVCSIYHILSTKLLFAFIFELILIKVFHFATIHNDSFTIFII